MAISSKQIGWGTEENLLWQISKQLELLTRVTGNIGGTTPSTPSINIIADGTVTNSPIVASYVKVGTISTVSGNQTVSLIDAANLAFYNGNCTTMSIPNVAVMSLTVSGLTNLVTLSLPQLTHLVNTGSNVLIIGSCSSLTTLDIPALVHVDSDSYLYLNYNAFSQATVDDVLVKFAATTAVNCSLDLSGGTNSAPSATGLAAKAVLEGRGWTITTN